MDLQSNCFFLSLQEHKRRFRGWVHCDPVKGVEIAYNKVDDGVPLRLWRGTTDIAIPPSLLLQRLWNERYASFTGLLVNLVNQIMCVMISILLGIYGMVR